MVETTTKYKEPISLLMVGKIILALVLVMPLVGVFLILSVSTILTILILSLVLVPILLFWETIRGLFQEIIPKLKDQIHL